MVDTTSLGIRFPEPTDNVELWTHLQNLAEDVDELLRQRGRVASVTYTTDSATFTTTLTDIGSITAPLVDGKRYKVVGLTHIFTTNGGDRAQLQWRDTNTVGTVRQNRNAEVLATNTGVGHYLRIEFDYVATATGNKTFVLCANRQNGTGTLNREADATNPTQLYVEYANVD